MIPRITHGEEVLVKVGATALLQDFTFPNTFR